MNARGLAELALKLWAVMQLISAVASVPAAALFALVFYRGGQASDGMMRVTQQGNVLILGTQLIVGIVILVWADAIVGWFEDDTTPLQIEVDKSELQRLAFSLTGIVFLVHGLEDAATVWYTWWKLPSFDQSEMWAVVWQRQGEQMVRGVVQIVAGGTLIAGRNRIARGWSRLRGHFVDNPSDDPLDDQ